MVPGGVALGRAVVVRSPGELDAAQAAGRLALVHCVEGGFHLGSSPAAVDGALAELARRGVAYITLAHLSWRHVATNAPAMPWAGDAVYDRRFPQPAVGLSELGRAAVAAMVRERVLIDLTHMSERALDDTFELLDALDPARSVPVIASHAGYRFGRRAYNLTAATVTRIAERGGVIGLILSDTYARDGLTPRTRTFEDSWAVLVRHVDRLREITGSHRHTALGSDLDGFIKPALAGLESASRLGRLEAAVERRYGADGEAIASGNALGLLRGSWGT